VRLRIGNPTMTNHPIHLHGHEFFITGTDGGPTPKSARWPEMTADIAVGQMRPLDFVADEEGDWAMHCRKSHHTMNAMGHDMTEMQMPLPDNTAPMMSGDGPFGSVGMGGMFSVLKVRRDQPRGDHCDPGWLRHPPDTVAYERTGALAEAPCNGRPAGTVPSVEVQVPKPGAGHDHH
jgi:hypothetical protein